MVDIYYRPSGCLGSKRFPVCPLFSGLTTVMVIQAMAVRQTSTLMLPIADHAPHQQHLSPMQPLLA
jgi:hypothetical protein